MDMLVDTSEIVLRLGLAIVFGGILGLEREWRRRPAGLRTHMMVAVGATTFTLVAFEFYAHAIATDTGVTTVDPLRILEGIIGGLGFLCAGTIIQNRGTVEGLTTAGSLWCVGAIGVATGGGHYVIAAATVVAALAILAGVRTIERHIESADS